jgi:hypothetical protein
MASGPLWTAEYDPERPQRSEALPSDITAPVPLAPDDVVIEIRRREIAAHVWVHPPSPPASSQGRIARLGGLASTVFQ